MRSIRLLGLVGTLLIGSTMSLQAGQSTFSAIESYFSTPPPPLPSVCIKVLHPTASLTTAEINECENSLAKFQFSLKEACLLSCHENGSGPLNQCGYICCPLWANTVHEFMKANKKSCSAFK